jgi:hypothetical protein
MVKCDFCGEEFDGIKKFSLNLYWRLTACGKPECQEKLSRVSTVYPMCKWQSAQVDCRNTECFFHDEGGQCKNTAPAITLNPDGTYVCWSEIKKSELIVGCEKVVKLQRR